MEERSKCILDYIGKYVFRFTIVIATFVQHRWVIIVFKIVQNSNYNFDSSFSFHLFVFTFVFCDDLKCYGMLSHSISAWKNK